MLQRPFAGRRRACNLQPATPLPTGLADLDMDAPSHDMTDLAEFYHLLIQHRHLYRTHPSLPLE